MRSVSHFSHSVTQWGFTGKLHSLTVSQVSSVVYFVIREPWVRHPSIVRTTGMPTSRAVRIISIRG